MAHPQDLDELRRVVDATAVRCAELEKALAVLSHDFRSLKAAMIYTQDAFDRYERLAKETGQKPQGQGRRKGGGAR